MKKLITFAAVLVLGVTLSGCTSDVQSIQDADSSVQNVSPFDNETTGDLEYEELESDETYGSTGALDNDTFTLEEMLVYALQDEYAARAEYDYIMNTFNVTKPFSNIIQSEETHITLLLPLFESYNLLLPSDTSAEHLITITSVEEAFNIGVQAEILNIAMYNLFLEQDDLPEDVRDVFIKLRDASENHLAAFEKNAAKY